MSFVDLENMTPQDLILHYVLECRGAGHFLPYLDYQVIEEWVRASADADDLLLVLSETLPDFFAKSRAGRKPRSLRGARRMVMSKLKERAMSRGVATEND
jgi:hypothetical protein